MWAVQPHSESRAYNRALPLLPRRTGREESGPRYLDTGNGVKRSVGPTEQNL
jgi:hypothetical protein